MKLNKYLLLLGMAAIGLLSSCDDDDDYQPGRQPNNMGVSFGVESSYSTATYLPNDEAVLTIQVYRKDAKEAADMPLVVNLNDSIDGVAVFDIPESVHFGAGQEVAEVTVKFPDAPLGETYSFEVEIPEEYKNLYATNLLRRSVMRDYDWIDYEGSLFTDFDGIASYVTVQHADGFPIWRVVDPFADYWENYYGGDIDYSIVAQYITFTINEDGSVKFDTYKSDTYEGSLIYAYWPLDLSADFAEEAAMSKVVDEQTVKLHPYYYVPDLSGGFGLNAVTITLDEEGASFLPEEEE